ncbi:MAG: flagellar biosynthesis protein FlhB [Alphaproteobacteria bacterium]
MIAEDDDDASKTEDPSQRKLEKAQEEGNTAMSQEAKTFIMMLGMIFVVWFIIPLMFKWYYHLTVKFIHNAGQMNVDERAVQLLASNTAIGIVKILAIPFAIFIVLGVVSSISQTGFVFAPQKLMPNWEKLNIFKGITEFITMKKVVESLKGILKISAVAFVSIKVVTPYIDDVVLMPSMETYAILGLIHKVVLLLIFTVAIAVLLIAAFDFFYQKYAFYKKMRMTKQEVKEEYKQQEGDPIIKSRQRALRNERAKRRMMDNVKKSDVVIVNPTHFAVALEYKMDKMNVPVVSAKGVDHLALRIRKTAEDNDIPVIENPPLARALHASVEIDQPIPEEHFKAVAEVISYVMQLKQEK